MRNGSDYAHQKAVCIKEGRPTSKQERVSLNAQHCFVACVPTALVLNRRSMWHGEGRVDSVSTRLQ
eukprot:1158495-Pelagomonas_calceolata.AAC.2